MMKQIFCSTIRNVCGALCCIRMVLCWVAAASLAVACTSELHFDNDSEYPDGLVQISIPFMVPQAEVRTRTQDITSVDIETMWVGMFAISENTAQREAKLVRTWDMVDLLTSDDPQYPDKKIGLNLIIGKKDGNTIYNELTGEEICAGNDDKTKFFFVAIANYKNIVAHWMDQDNKEQEGQLIEKLRKVKTWEEYCSIAIDTRNAYAQKYPIMVGGLIERNSAFAQMIYPENFNFCNTEEFKSYTYKQLVDDLSLSSNAKFYLRRLISRITVNVTADFDESGYEKVTVKNIRYAVVNCPKSVWLQERIVPEGRSIPEDVFEEIERYKTYSANYNDWSKGGFYNLAEDMEFIPVEGDEYLYDATSNTALKKYTFSYHRYENKHTGVADKYVDREAVGEDGLFTALGGEANNFAPYFVIKADMEVTKAGEESLNITAQYVIHEGYANNYKGENKTNSGLADAERLRDFSCIRNTNYTYNITITGVNSILVQVNTETPEEGRNGVTGDVSYILGSKAFNGDGFIAGNESNKKEWEITLTNEQRRNIGKYFLFVIPYRAKLSDDNWIVKRVGVGYSQITTPAVSPVSYFGDVISTNGRLIDKDNEFFNWVQFIDKDGKPYNILDFATNTSSEEDEAAHKYTVTVGEYKKDSYQHIFDEQASSFIGSEQESLLSPVEDSRALYFCVEQPKSNKSTYQEVYFLTQSLRDNRPKLPAPTIDYFTTPMYVNETAEIGWSVASDAENRRYIDHYKVTASGNTYDEKFNADGHRYNFFVPTSYQYGDNLDFSVASYPKYLAEYAPSEAKTENQLVVFKHSYTWNHQFEKIPTDETNFADWTDYGNTLALKGKIKYNNALQLVGSGPNNACRITIPESGSLEVKFSNSGGNNDQRTLSVEMDDEYLKSTQTTDNITPVTEKFYLVFDDEKPKKVNLYSTDKGGLRIYSITYNGGEYKPTIWSSTSEDGKTIWSDFINNFSGDGYSSEHLYSNGGLAIYNGNGATTKASGSYIQMTKSGDIKQYIAFRASSSGKLTVEVSGTGSTKKGDNRKLAVQVGAATPTEVDSDFTSTDRKELTFDINVQEPTVVYISVSGETQNSACGNRFYSIKYTGRIDSSYTGNN